jgi:hypothetical protein
MKSVLLIYRGRVFDTEIKPRLEEFKNDNITLVTENKYTRSSVRYLIEDYTQKVNLLTIDEFLDDTIITKFMKFKAIIGNPPYQDNDSESDAGKLYIDITKKSMNLLTDDGIIDFHTPDTLVRDGRNKFTIKQKGLRSVDYTANESFREGVTIINWIYDKSYNQDEVEVINKDKSVDIRKYTDSLVDKNDILFVNLIERIKSTPEKLFYLDQSAKNRFDEYKNGLFKVYSNVNKNKVFYTDKKPVLYGKRKLAISLSSSYKEELLYDSTEDFGQLHVMVDISNYTQTEINNLKSYLFNPISIAICKMYRLVSGQGMNAILYSFPKVDVSKNYNNQGVIDVFNLTLDEVELLKKYVD